MFNGVTLNKPKSLNGHQNSRPFPVAVPLAPEQRGVPNQPNNNPEVIISNDRSPDGKKNRIQSVQ